MADKRMVSLSILNSARFLKMPISAQALYVHLVVRADDDGIVESYAVLRLIGANEDDLKILAAKRYVVILNDDYVTYINDWTEFNILRADRSKDSIYHELLVSVLPDVPVLVKKERSDRGPKKKTSGTSHGLSVDGIGQARLGQDRIEQQQDKSMVVTDNMIALNTGIDINPDVIERCMKKYGMTAVRETIRLLNRKYQNGYKMDNPSAMLSIACRDDWISQEKALKKGKIDCPECHGTGRIMMKVGDTGAEISILCQKCMM